MHQTQGQHQATGQPARVFADRLSTDEMQGSQLRLYFSALA